MWPCDAMPCLRFLFLSLLWLLWSFCVLFNPQQCLIKCTQNSFLKTSLPCSRSNNMFHILCSEVVCCRKNSNICMQWTLRLTNFNCWWWQKPYAAYRVESHNFPIVTPYIYIYMHICMYSVYMAHGLSCFCFAFYGS